MDADRQPARGKGYGKLIVFGEHAVVYGTPAVVGSLPTGAEATASRRDAGSSRVRVEGPDDREPSAEQRETIDEAFRAMLESFGDVLGEPVEVEVCVHIPVGVGLGSSAAFCAATARALVGSTELEDGRAEAIADAVEAGEGVFHGDPSGIDQSAALEGGLQFFRPGDPIERAEIDVEGCRFGICVAGPPASTSEMVARVADFRDREPELFEYVKLLIGDTARFGSGAMRNGDWERVGELMDVNHGALSTLGVSTPELDRACHVARDAGALGAKLTGAGGGGCVVALLPEEDEDVLSAWEQQGWEAFAAEF